MTIATKLSAIFLVYALFGCGEQQGAYQKLDMKSPELLGIEKATNLSGAERWGRWTDGSPLKLQFASGLPKEFRLLLTVAHIYGPNTGKQIEVQVADQRQTFIGPAEGDKTVIQLDFKGVPKSTDTLQIAVPETLSQEGERKLGIGFESLEIAPLK